MTRTRPRLVFAVLFTAALAFAQRGPIPQQLVFTPYHASGIYDIGETVGWNVMPGPVAPTYLYKWTIRRNNAVVLKEGKLDLSSGKDKIEIAADQPEMIYVAVEAYANLNGEVPPPVSAPAPQGASAAGPGRGAAPLFVGGNTGRNNGFYAVGAAVAPLKIGLSTPRPADFDAFWDAKLAAQAKVPINPVLTPVQTDVPGVEMSMFVLDALGSKAHGYLAKPAKEGKFPAVVQLQYAGVYALNAGAVAQRAAEGWLMINVDSHDKLPSDPSGDIPRAYQAVGNTDRENSYFLNMYLRDSRALDYLLTRPDWDGKTIVLTGGSMGGQQSLVLAGLRPEKITAALVCVPAGADTNGDLHGRKAGYPNWPPDNPDAMKTALYFDTVNFASRIKAPVMAGMGFIDTTSPPAGVWTMLNQIPVPKEPLPMIESDHDNFTPDKGRACPARTRELLNVLVNGGEFKPNGILPQTIPAEPAARPAIAAAQTQAPSSAPKPDDLGFTDTPMLPGLPWHVHDPARPHAPVVTPGATPGMPPSDAIVLFDGKDLSRWVQLGRGADRGKLVEAKWPLRDGYFEVAPGTGDLQTRDKFGDIQLHVEWSEPPNVSGTSQGRGNSGVLLMALYEIQVLDAYNNPTYADGQAAAIYGQWPPLANAARKPGEWQTYDIVFEAPRFEGDKLIKPAYQTVFWNGVMIHLHKELMGPMVYRQVARYRPHDAELPIALQDHHDPVRYRNIWVRRLSGYDQPEK